MSCFSEKQQTSRQLKNIKISIIVTAIFLLIYSGFTSCKKIPNPNIYGNEKDTITYDLLKTSLHFQFVDASTNENIIPGEGKELKVRIVGNSKNAVVDIMGTQKSEYIASQGLISFGLIPGTEFIPSPESPVCITIIAKLENYITASKDVTITSEGDYMMKIFMVNIENPPSGVIIEQKYDAGNLINGSLQETISIATANSEAIVVIPAGVRLLDADGIELVGKLDVTLSYHNSGTDEALEVFAGGITGTVIDQNITNQGMFFPAGLLSIKITDSDLREAFIIEGDKLEITIRMNNQAYNPQSGSTIIVGDSVPLFLHISDTGLWQFDQWAHVADNILNGLYATVKTSGLGSLHFSWFEENNCNNRSKFKLTGKCTHYKSVVLNGVVRKQVDNSFISTISLAAQWDEPINIPLSTGNIPIYIEWEQSNECNNCFVEPSASTLFIDDMCSGQTIDLPVMEYSPSSVSISAIFNGICPADTNVVVLPSFGVWVRPIDAYCWRWSSMKNGVAQISNVIYGNTYIIGTYYDNTWKEWEVTITEETTYTFKIEFSQSACTSVFGL